MGGWVAFAGPVDDFQARVERFRKIFSVPNVPALKIEVCEISSSFRVLLWAWNKHHIPDVYVQKNKNGDALLLCGVITGTGSLCAFDPDQEITAKNIFDRWLSADNFPIEQLNGSFSCLFFNSQKNRTEIFVDRFASRSVWTFREKDIWSAGNFPSAVSACLNETPKIDLAGLWALLHYGRHIGKHGIFAGMHCLLAGQKTVLSSEKELNVSNWWERRYRPEAGLSAKDWGKRIADALRVSAGRYKKVSPNPYLYLSGGIDSRIAAAALGKPVKTITLCTQPNAETKNAFRVAGVLGMENRAIVRSPYWYLDAMAAASLISSGNYLNQHTHFIVPTREIADTNPEATFFLGDLLENFNKHYFLVPKGWKLKFDPETIETDLNQMIPSTVKDKARWGLHLNERIRETARNKFSEALKEHARSILRVSEDPADCFDSMLRWFDVSATYTYNMFTCIWPLASERNLCFDNDLNDISLALPSNLRGAGIVHKWLLYFLNKKLLLIADANVFLPPFAPKWMKKLAKEFRPVLGKLRRGLIRFKGKKIILNTSGSWLLLHEMYRKDNRYIKDIEETIEKSAVQLINIFDSTQIKKSWEQYLQGQISLDFELEALLSFIKLNSFYSEKDY
jgi:hypothetical protein